MYIIMFQPNKKLGKVGWHVHVPFILFKHFIIFFID